MKGLKNTIVAGLMMITASFAYAGDESYSQVLGFSKDGQYFAYVQSGIQDGSGFFWAQVDVIDTFQNKLLKRVYDDSEEESLNDEASDFTPSEEQQFINNLVQTAGLNRYGIDQNTKGRTVLSRSYTDMSEYKDTVFSIKYWAQGGASTSVERFKINLTEQKAPTEIHNQWCQDDFGYKSNMITLTLTGPTFGDEEDQSIAQTLTLQKDLRAPSSRSCAYDYKVAQIINFNNAIIVLVNYQTPGFEGPNYRFMAVTGKIK